VLVSGTRADNGEIGGPIVVNVLVVVEGSGKKLRKSLRRSEGKSATRKSLCMLRRRAGCGDQ
jgi:hypothetical protein